MDHSDNNKFEFSKVISYTTSILSLITALCILFSLISDIFYYGYFKINLLELPTTIQDHLKSSISLLPVVMGFSLTIYLLEMLSTRHRLKYGKDNFLTKDISDEKLLDCIINSRNFPIPKVIIFIFYLSLALSIVIVSLSLYLKAYIIMLSALIFVVPAAFTILMWKTLMHPNVDRVKRKLIFNISILLFVTFVITPTMSTLAAWSGSIKRENVLIHLKDNSRKKLQVKIIRNYEKSAFIVYSTNKIAIIPQTDILMIEKSYK